MGFAHACTASTLTTLAMPVTSAYLQYTWASTRLCCLWQKGQSQAQSHPVVGICNAMLMLSNKALDLSESTLGRAPLRWLWLCCSSMWAGQSAHQTPCQH